MLCRVGSRAGSLALFDPVPPFPEITNANTAGLNPLVVHSNLCMYERAIIFEWVVLFPDVAEHDILSTHICSDWVCLFSSFVNRGVPSVLHREYLAFYPIRLLALSPPPHDYLTPPRCFYHRSDCGSESNPSREVTCFENSIDFTCHFNGLSSRW